MSTVNDKILDLDLSALRKKRFRIDGDDNKILELNTSDLSVINRLSETYPKLEALQKKASEIGKDNLNADDKSIMDDIEEMSRKLSDVDSQMRELVDYIFDSNVCEICVTSGSMYDPLNGQLRYEILIGILSDLYEEQLSDEMKKIKARVKKHTNKYAGKK